MLRGWLRCSDGLSLDSSVRKWRTDDPASFRALTLIARSARAFCWCERHGRSFGCAFRMKPRKTTLRMTEFLGAR
jgi:hypothetical protein